MMTYSSLQEILHLFRPNDTLAVPLATGQPVSLLNALSERTDWKELKIYSGLFVFPYPILTNPHVQVTSGYYGPIERFLNEKGAYLNYLPASFMGIEKFAIWQKPRVLATTVSEPDKEGYVTLGTHGAAMYKAFVEAIKNKDQLVIAEINPSMPVVYGIPEYGDNKVSIDQIPYAFKAQSSQVEAPIIEPIEVEQKIAENVASLIESKATLQFGIGGIPNQVATLLSKGSCGDFGIHSEMISDGFLKLWEAGKISNKHKGIFKNQTVFTFSFGSQVLYDFLDERKGRNKRQAVCLPVSISNNPSIIAQNPRMVSINSGLMIDFAGQVCSEAIGLKQYSGVGGQLEFGQGAYFSEEGKSILCIKSTATVDGNLVSNICSVLPPGSLVSTPRHFVEYIVTEYGVVNLYGVPDEKRPEKLIPLAHPQFRDELTKKYEEIKRKYYKN